MFDLKTRKRDFEQQLFFLLEKSQTSGTKSKFQEIERRKVARPRDRRAQRDLFDIFAFRKPSLTVSFHHHRSTPRNRRTPTFFFFLSKRDRYKNEKKKKRKEVCELREAHRGFCLPRSFRRRRNDLSERNEKRSFLIIARLRERAFFHAALPPRETKNETHTKRKEKTRTPKNTPPFLKMSQHDATKKVEKLFFCSFFYAKTGDGSVADVLVRGFPLAPKRLLTLCLRLVSWSERGKKTYELFLNEAFFLPFLV